MKRSQFFAPSKLNAGWAHRDTCRRHICVNKIDENESWAKIVLGSMLTPGTDIVIQLKLIAGHDT